jgi:hypothetical protein
MKPLTSHRSALRGSTASIQLWIVIMLALALATARGAAPAATPLLQLDPIVVANGSASVSGSVSSEAASATLSVNGQPLGLDAAGAFSGVVPLNGASTIAIALNQAGSDQQVQFEIPLTGALLGPGGVIPAGVLDSLEQAGVSLLTPILGTDSKPVTVGGTVLDGSQLGSLAVNGKDVLGALSDGAFSVQLPGTTKVVTLTATDTSGNSQTTTSSVIHTSLAGTTVSAAGALGIRIVKVRFYKQLVVRKHRLRMVVTVKDRRGLLVRGAKITVRSPKAGRLVRQPRASLSGAKGRVTIVLRLRQAALGKLLAVNTVATTPRAKAAKKNGTNLPRAKSRAGRKAGR